MIASQPTISLIYFIGGILFGLGYLFPGTLIGALFVWIAVLIWVVLCKKKLGVSAGSFFLIGVGLHLTVFHWLLKIIASYWEFGFALASSLFLLFVVVAAVQFIAVYYVYHWLLKTWLGTRKMALASAWVTIELLFPRLVPWDLGHSQLALTPLAQLADLFGVPFISWIVIWWSELFIEVILHKGTINTKRNAVTLFVSMFVVLCYAKIRIYRINDAILQATTLAIGIVQPNLDSKLDFKPERFAYVNELYRELSSKLLTQGNIDLLIWPESSFWTTFSATTRKISPFSPDHPFPGLTVPLVFGGQSAPKQSKAEKMQLYNSAFLLLPDGIFSHYFKHYLFPFTEEIPGEGWLPFLKELDQKSYRVARGLKDQLPFRLKSVNGSAQGEVPLGVAICYEDMWSEPLRRMVMGGGAEILVALSNDAWFQRTLAAAQHHLVGSWRAIELRRYLIRSTVDGVSAIIDPMGREVERMPLFQQSVLRAEKVRPLRIASVYSSLGDWPMFILAIGVLAYCLFNSGKRYLN